jgi:cytoskeletal protein RodZ
MKNEDDFISQIEDTLHAHEDAYVPGAWEAFQQKRKRRRVAMLFFRAGTAAAVLLLLGYGAISFFSKQDPVNQFTQVKNHSNQPLTKTPQAGNQNIITDSAVAIEKNNGTHSYRDTARPMLVLAKPDTARPAQNLTKQATAKPIQSIAKYSPVDKSSIIGKNTDPLMAANTPSTATNINKPVDKFTVAADTARPAKSAVSAAQKGIIANNQTQVYKQDSKPVYDMLVKNKSNHQPEELVKPKIKSLTYAVIVSPALGNQKVNFGTGVQVSYHFNNNLSVSGGLAYSALNASASGNVSNDATRKVQGVSLAVSGFEVPVGLQYKTDKGFYVSAGVIGMSVSNDHLNYNYLSQTTVTTLAPNASGLTESVLRVATEEKTEESKEKINNYMGFYILSIGKKKAVGRNQINFGPFLRVPFGTVSSEKLNLTQGGVHLGFEF